MPGDPSVPPRASAAGNPTRAARSISGQGHRPQDAGHREPAVTQPDLAAHGGDPEPLGRLGPEHHHRVAGGGPVQEPPGGQLPAEGAEQLRVGREHADAARLGLGDPVAAAHAGPGVAGGRHPLDRPDPAQHADRLGGQLGLVPEEGLARGDPEQVGAEGVELGQQVGPARLGDAEHGHHGRDPDGDSEGGEGRPQPPRAQPVPGHPEQVAGLMPAPRRRRPARSGHRAGRPAGGGGRRWPGRG